jgi:hypothetical protein
MVSHISIYFNLHEGHFFGYEHGHPVQKLFSYEAPSTSDLMELAEEAFGAFNAPLELLAEPYRVVAERYRAAGNRSLYVGDVLNIDESWLACASSGWVELEQAPVEVRGE